MSPWSGFFFLAGLVVQGFMKFCDWSFDPLLPFYPSVTCVMWALLKEDYLNISIKIRSLRPLQFEPVSEFACVCLQKKRKSSTVSYLFPVQHSQYLILKWLFKFIERHRVYSQPVLISCRGLLSTWTLLGSKLEDIANPGFAYICVGLEVAYLAITKLHPEFTVSTWPSIVICQTDSPCIYTNASKNVLCSWACTFMTA